MSRHRKQGNCSRRDGAGTARPRNLPPLALEALRERARFAETFTKQLAAHFERNAQDLFDGLLRARKQEYARLILALLPKDYRSKKADAPALTDRQLRSLRAAIGEPAPQQTAPQAEANGVGDAPQPT
jgi:hypothetical protein